MDGIRRVPVVELLGDEARGGLIIILDHKGESEEEARSDADAGGMAAGIPTGMVLAGTSCDVMPAFMLCHTMSAQLAKRTRYSTGMLYVTRFTTVQTSAFAISNGASLVRT